MFFKSIWSWRLSQEFLLNTGHRCFVGLFWPLTSRPTNRRVAVCSVMLWWCGEVTGDAIVDIRILWQLLSFSSPRPSFLPLSSHTLPNLPACSYRFLLPPFASPTKPEVAPPCKTRSVSGECISRTDCHLSSRKRRHYYEFPAAFCTLPMHQMA